LKTKNERWEKMAKGRQMLEMNGFATETWTAQKKAGPFLEFRPLTP